MDGCLRDPNRRTPSSELNLGSVPLDFTQLAVRDGWLIDNNAGSLFVAVMPMRDISESSPHAPRTRQGWRANPKTMDAYGVTIVTDRFKYAGALYCRKTMWEGAWLTQGLVCGLSAS